MTVGRNEPCPCGSGRKYKHCHGAAGPAPAAGAAPDEAAYRQALRRNPQDLAALMGLGALLYGEARMAEAEAVLRAATVAAPGEPSAHCNLGVALLALGRAPEAAQALQRARALDPRSPAALANLGAALQRLERPAEAEEALRAALAVDERNPSAHSNLGNLLQQRHDPAALACYDRAIALDPRFVDAHFNRASLLREQGRIGDAVAALRRTIALAPQHLPAWANLLLTLLYADDVAPAEVLVWHRRFDTLQGMLRGGPAPAPAPLRRDARPLRVGLLSPDLRRHSVAYFVEPLFEHHDRGAVALFAYHDSAVEDEVSARLRAHAARWRNVAALDDDRLAQTIAGDGIDVLVDLAGPTGLRLPLLARRAAPVQAAWLGYPASTGLAAMDRRITDARADPPAHDALHSERPARLPHSYFCFRPPAEAPEPGPPPSVAAGTVTFGSFNHVAKISPTTVRLWAGVLRAVPGSRLLLKAAGLADASVRERLGAEFAARGVDGGRLLLRGWEERTAAHLAAYGEVDVALDTTPFNGATTTCEALWMGVPVVSLAGDRSQARMGASILAAAGCGEWVAADADAFVAAAARLASSAGELRAVRAGLRERLRASPLLDGAAFARDFETLLQSLAAGA